MQNHGVGNKEEENKNGYHLVPGPGRYYPRVVFAAIQNIVIEQGEPPVRHHIFGGVHQPKGGCTFIVEKVLTSSRGHVLPFYKEIVSQQEEEDQQGIFFAHPIEGYGGNPHRPQVECPQPHQASEELFGKEEDNHSRQSSEQDVGEPEPPFLSPLRLQPSRQIYREEGESLHQHGVFCIRGKIPLHIRVYRQQLARLVLAQPYLFNAIRPKSEGDKEEPDEGCCSALYHLF